jgi:hypothetical protein
MHWPTPPECLATYTLSGKSGHTVSWTFQPPCKGALVARWSLQNGQLRFRVRLATDVGDAMLLAGKPWRKIG